MSTNQTKIKTLGFMAATVGWMMCTGCYETYEPDSVGSLSVPFTIAYNGSSCEAAGVERVVAVLGDNDYRAEVECGQYEVFFEDVDAGAYGLSLFGLNSEGITVVDNLANGPETVDIAAFTETVPAAPLVLSETPVVLEARWDLDWGSCSSRGIGYFQAKVFDFEENILFESLVSCDTAGTGAGEFRIFPDQHRDLTDPDIARIEVEALKNKTKSIGDAFKVEFEDINVPGAGESISLSFKCLENGCFTSGGGCPAI